MIKYDIWKHVETAVEILEGCLTVVENRNKGESEQ